MSDEQPVRIELRCSNCDRVLGTLPEGGQLETDLVCPNCGATVAAPGTLQKVVDEVKDAIDEITRRRERKPDK